jgi:hypothetical protein
MAWFRARLQDQENLQSLSSPLSVLHPTYHNGSVFLKLLGAGARATQYGCAILHAGAIDELNSCLSVPGIAWLRAVSLAHISTSASSQFPCFRTVEEERVIRTKDKADFLHRIACSPSCLQRESYRGEIRTRSAGCPPTTNTTEGLALWRQAAHGGKLKTTNQWLPAVRVSGAPK